MKKSLTLFLIGLSLASTPVLGAETIKVFLIGGQSNADGRAFKSDLPTTPVNLQQPQTDIKLWPRNGYDYSQTTYVGWTDLAPGYSYFSSSTYGTYFGPEITFGRTLSDYVKSRNFGLSVAIIKAAWGGTNLYSQWKAGGNGTQTGDGSYYVSFQNDVTLGLNALKAAHPTADVQLAGMLWVQGESDCDAGQAASYGANLKRFIQDVRFTFTAYGSSDMPFFFSRLSENQTRYWTYDGTQPDILRAQQATVVNPASANYVAGAYMLDIDDDGKFTTGTVGGVGIHFDAWGQRNIGNAFGNAVIAAGAVPEPGTIVLLLSAIFLMLICYCRIKGVCSPFSR
jgi:hypothetical protein